MTSNSNGTPLTGAPKSLIGFGSPGAFSRQFYRLRRSAIAADMAEAKWLDRWLRRHADFPIPGYSCALLARALAQRDLMYMARQLSMTWLLIAPIMLPFLIFGLPTLIALWRGEGFHFPYQPLFSILAYYLALLVCIQAINRFQRGTPDSERFRQFWPHHGMPPAKPGRGPDIALLIFIAALVVPMAWLAWSMSRTELIQAAINSFGALLWLVTIMIAIVLFGRRRTTIRRWSQVELVRSLATACFLFANARPAQWRDIRFRRKIAAKIGTAASILEVPTLRLLAAIGVGPGAREWQLVRKAAAGLRSLAARTIIGDGETSAPIARSLSTALRAAVAGNMSRIEAGLEAIDQPDGESVFVRGARLARRVAVAFLPAVGALAIIVAGERYGWALAADARPILIQFAIVSAIIGLMSAFDPLGYQQRIGAITGSGGSMFGWGKGRG